MKIMMRLVSDAVFGNGNSVPGGEDIAVLHDSHGFPKYKGSTFKGIFREELINLLLWKGCSEEEAIATAKNLLGASGDDEAGEGKLVFSDFVIPKAVRDRVLEEIGDRPDEILASFTSLRTFTRLTEDGMVAKGSLRIARCVNQGIWLESELSCKEEQKELVLEVLSLMKWIGTMRNRGFGKVQIMEEA